jgi:hypothetical protein
MKTSVFANEALAAAEAALALEVVLTVLIGVGLVIVCSPLLQSNPEGCGQAAAVVAVHRIGVPIADSNQYPNLVAVCRRYSFAKKDWAATL